MSKAYNVSLSCPPNSEGNDKTWRTNVNALVIAETITLALEKVVQKYPQAQVDSIKHAGTRDIIL